MPPTSVPTNWRRCRLRLDQADRRAFVIRSEHDHVAGEADVGNVAAKAGPDQAIGEGVRLGRGGELFPQLAVAQDPEPGARPLGDDPQRDAEVPVDALDLHEPRDQSDHLVGGS